MEFPRLKKRFKALLSSVECVVDSSKRIVLSAGLLTLTSGQSAAQPKIPADPKQTLEKSQISKYSAKYLLRAAAGSFSQMLAQHRSHSSHSSHRSHSSHSSHYSSSSTPSHASHYSSSYPAPAPTPAPSTPPRTTVRPRSSSPDSAPLRGSGSSFGFSDGFDGGPRTSPRWVAGALNADDASYDEQVTVVERNRRLEIAPLANVTGRHFNGYMSAGEWDLTGARVGVEVVQAAEAADTVFAIGVDSDNWYGFVAEEGTLYLQSKVKGVKSPKSVPYSAARHRFWRFRLDSASNTVTWETSPDGSSWEAQRRETLQLDITAVHVTLSAGTYKETKSPGTAVFDNFRLER
jgi:hypothetical protein